MKAHILKPCVIEVPWSSSLIEFIKNARVAYREKTYIARRYLPYGVRDRTKPLFVMPKKRSER